MIVFRIKKDKMVKKKQISPVNNLEELLDISIISHFQSSVCKKVITSEGKKKISSHTPTPWIFMEFKIILIISGMICVLHSSK